MDILIPEVGVVGLETLDSILEGILDNENSNSSSSDLQEKIPNLQELSPASSSMIASSPTDISCNSENETQNLRCITIKSELPDSCSIMMDYADSSSSQTSPEEIKLFEAVLSPESPDQQCSSTTFLNSERHHRLQSADSFRDDEDEPKRCCLVCGDVASGYHYGVSSCEACKAFFKRTIQGNIDYTCPASNDCEINKRRRKACQACRFQKCLKSGMLKEGVRLDRVRGGRQKYRRLMDNSYTSMSLNGPQKPPLTLDDNKLLNSLISCEPETVLALPDSSVPDDEKITQMLSNLYEKQLVGIIEWAKQIPGFTDLSLNDQMRLLQGSWSEVLTLSLIFRTLPTTVAAASASAKESEAGLRRRLKFAPDFALTEAMALQIDLEEFYNHCVNILDRSDRLGLRREEYLILKAILVSNCDVQIEEATALRKLRDNLLASLHDCVAVIRSGNTSVHVQNLLLLLPSIRQADAMIRWFWLKIRQERKIPLKKLMVEMLDVSVDKICMQKLKSKKS